MSTLPQLEYRSRPAGEQTSNSVAECASTKTLAPLLRVLHVHSGNLYGGVETTLIAQARHQNLCPEMELAFALCFAGRFSEELTTAGASVHWLESVRIRHPLSVRRARQRLRELLRRERFDLVVTHSAWSQAIFGPVVRASGLPLVFWLHGAADGRHWLERWASRTRPDLVICNSRFTASTLPNIYQGTKAEVIFPPLILAAADEAPLERNSIRRQLDTPESAVVIVQVSRMEAGKGHAAHLKALSSLKGLPDWICWQVGGAQRAQEIEYVKSLKELASDLGIADRVRFLGERSDIQELLAAADIFCQSNTSPDGFGLTFIEALQSGLPIVTTAIGGAMEIVNDSCGILVPPADPRALAVALSRLIQDRALRMKLGAAGLPRARELCDLSTQMRHLHTSLVEICR